MEEQELTFEQMHILFTDGVIGYKEFRNWLSAQFTSFALARDSSVDNMLDEIARQRAEERRLLESQEETANSLPGAAENL
jgi:hypothetical protein